MLTLGVALTDAIFTTCSTIDGVGVRVVLETVLFESSETISLFPWITTLIGFLFFNSLNVFLSKVAGIGTTWVCVD